MLEAVKASGYTTPTPIQAQAIPHALAGRDVLGIAQTGTGKTAAFTLPMLSRLEQGRARARMPRTLILEPTRELAAQVEESFRRYGVNHKLNVALLIGGVSFGDQEAKIMRGADVLIATPGRLLDFAERGKLLLTGIEILVIDEADRMLDMGFIPDIERICKLVPFTRQTLFFSATMPPEITRLTEHFLHNPVRIEVARAAIDRRDHHPGAGGLASGAEKRETLRRFIRAVDNFKNAIIFCNRKRDVAIVCTNRCRSTAFAPARCMATWTSARAWPRSTRSRTAMSICSSARTSRRAASTFPTSAMSSILTCPTMPRIMSIASAAPAAPASCGTAISIVTRSDQKHLAEIEKLIGRAVEWQQGATLDTLSQDDEEEASPRHRGGRRTGGERTRAPREHSAREPREHGKRTREAPHDAPRASGHAAKAHDSTAHEFKSHEPRSHEPRPHASKAPDQRLADQKDRGHHRPERARSRDNGHDDQPVVGMGDHVPSFLLRPVKLKPSVVEEAEEA